MAEVGDTPLESPSGIPQEDSKGGSIMSRLFENREKDCMTHFHEGLACSARGDHEGALLEYEKAIRFNSFIPDAHNNMGVIYKNINKPKDAIKCYEACLRIDPTHQKARFNAAVAWTDTGSQLSSEGAPDHEVMECYEKSLFYNPLYASAHYNIGVLHMGARRLERARIEYELAVALEPQFAEAFNNLGLVNKSLDLLQPAIENFRQALFIRPSLYQTSTNMASVLGVIGQVTEGMVYAYSALQSNPEYMEAEDVLGIIRRDMGEVSEAIKSFDKCLDMEPKRVGSWQNKLLSMNYMDECLEDIFDISVKGSDFGESVTLCGEGAGSETSTDVSVSKTLRIGYLSPDFFQHSVSYFILGVLLNHSSNVSVYLYSVQAHKDNKTEVFKSLPHTWRDITSMNLNEICQTIRKDNINILFDLAGHTSNNRIDVFMAKPAPIQISWIGYPNTTGLSTIDYRITDEIADPRETHQKYTEELLYLPQCFLCYTPPTGYPDVTYRSENKRITFASFNVLPKVQTPVLKAWSRILKRVPNSRLLIKAKPFVDPMFTSSFKRRLKDLGIDPDAVECMPMVPSTNDHLNTYNYVDVCLDTFPYCGTTTTCEALLMGVPVVTLTVKNNHASNVGATILSCVGLNELITHNVDDYVDKAVAIASNREQLSTYRSTIRSTLLESRLCDAKTLTSSLEETLFSLLK